MQKNIIEQDIWYLQQKIHDPYSVIIKDSPPTLL